MMQQPAVLLIAEEASVNPELLNLLATYQVKVVVGNPQEVIPKLLLQLQGLQVELETQRQQIVELTAQWQQELVARTQAEATLVTVQQELQRLVSIDRLTQTATRRYFDEYLQQEWRRTVREQTPLSLVLCEIDEFKSYNDTYGISAGEDCLVKIASEIKKLLKRARDLVARYGDDTFMIALPNTPITGAVFIAQQICQAVSALQLVHSPSPISDYVTLSVGVVSTRWIQILLLSVSSPKKLQTSVPLLPSL